MCWAVSNSWQGGIFRATHAFSCPILYSLISVFYAIFATKQGNGAKNAQKSKFSYVAVYEAFMLICKQTDFLRLCDKASIALRKGLYRTPIEPLSRCDRAFAALRKSLYRDAIGPQSQNRLAKIAWRWAFPRFFVAFSSLENLYFETLEKGSLSGSLVLNFQLDHVTTEARHRAGNAMQCVFCPLPNHPDPMTKKEGVQEN
jgi:hypothetical protein